jgi:hypothetical protein
MKIMNKGCEYYKQITMINKKTCIETAPMCNIYDNSNSYDFLIFKDDCN